MNIRQLQQNALDMPAAEAHQVRDGGEHFMEVIGDPYFAKIGLTVNR